LPLFCLYPAPSKVLAFFRTRPVPLLRVTVNFRLPVSALEKFRLSCHFWVEHQSNLRISRFSFRPKKVNFVHFILGGDGPYTFQCCQTGSQFPQGRFPVALEGVTSTPFVFLTPLGVPSARFFYDHLSQVIGFTNFSQFSFGRFELPFPFIFHFKSPHIPPFFFCAAAKDVVKSFPYDPAC